MSTVTQFETATADEVGNVDGTATPGFSAADLSRVLSLGTNLLVGRYSVELASGTWWWSDEVYTMHGWKRDEVEPGLEALRSRKHPDDRSRVVRAAGEALRLGRPFACSHRIVDRSGRTRSVVVTGQGSQNPRTRAPQLVGYVVDVTPVQNEALERRSEGVVNRAFISQAAIEQVKGIIIAVRGVDEPKATDILVNAARDAGVSLRLAADQIIAALQKQGGGAPVTVDMLDDALHAVHPVARPRGHDPLLTRRPRKTQK
jgi:hypothetical protein